MTETFRLNTEMERGAFVSPCGTYRYWLTRRWAEGPTVVWVMLNPSTADAAADDPTIRKCVGFARRWDCGAIKVVNLYAYRATDPKTLRAAQAAGVDVIGPWNARHVSAAVDGEHDLVIAAWGAHEPPGTDQVTNVTEWSRGRMQCLGRSRSGQPRHPLMLGYDTDLEPWAV